MINMKSAEGTEYNIENWSKTLIFIFSSLDFISKISLRIEIENERQEKLL